MGADEPSSRFSGNSSGGLPRRLTTSSPWKLNPAKSVCLEYVMFSYLWFLAPRSSEAGGQETHVVNNVSADRGGHRVKVFVSALT